jgi:hypothetical protein
MAMFQKEVLFRNTTYHQSAETGEYVRLSCQGAAHNLPSVYFESKSCCTAQHSYTAKVGKVERVNVTGKSGKAYSDDVPNMFFAKMSSSTLGLSILL